MARISPGQVCLALAAALWPGIAHAQEPPDTFRLDPLVVTATRVPLPRTAVPAAVSVLDGEALRARGIRFVADALREVPGMHIVRSGATGALTSAFVRGGESDHVQVLIDGVQVNDPGGAFDFSSLTMADVERIEVVRGPVSVLYGSDAVAGAVHIVTRRGEGPPRVEAAVGGARSRRVGQSATGGSGSLDASLTVSGTGRGIGWALSAARLHSDGAYAYNNAYGNSTAGGRLRASPDSRTDLGIVARYTNAVFRFPTDGAGALVDRNQFRTSESFAIGLEGTRRLSSRVSVRLAATRWTGDYRVDDAPDDVADTVGFYALRSEDRLVRRVIDVSLEARPVTGTTLTAGIEAERQMAAGESVSRSSFGPFEAESDRSRSSRALYTQLVAGAHGTVTVTAGGRIDDNDRFGTFATYRLGANWRVAPDLVVRAAAGSAFKEPTFYENYAAGFVTGDPGLEPERTRNIELGIEHWALGRRLVLAATLFDQRLRNLIQFTFAPPAPGSPNYYNVGAAGSRGLELAARWTSGTGLTASASLDWLRTEVHDAGFGADPAFVEGETLLRRPGLRAALSAGWRAGRWHADARVSGVGARDDLDFRVDFNGERVRLPAWATLDLAGGYAILRGPDGPALDAVLRIENAFDESYVEVRNFPALRRAVYVGLRARLRP